jgi:hypothetical protein
LSPGKPGAGRIFGLKSSSLQAFLFGRNNAVWSTAGNEKRQARLEKEA